MVPGIILFDYFIDLTLDLIDNPKNNLFNTSVTIKTLPLDFDNNPRNNKIIIFWLNCYGFRVHILYILRKSIVSKIEHWNI